VQAQVQEQRIGDAALGGVRRSVAKGMDRPVDQGRRVPVRGSGKGTGVRPAKGVGD
jgi:hypothetical protein